MADIFIKISDEIISFVNINGFIPQKYIRDVSKAMLESIPLPKGHGSLIDADELLNTFWTYCRKGDFGYHQAEDLIKSAKPVIEADKAESEVNNG